MDDELTEAFSLMPDWAWAQIDEIINDGEEKKRTRKKRPRYPVVWKRDRPHPYVCQSINNQTDFPIPKSYFCGYCNAEMVNMRVFLHHLKRHRESEIQMGDQVRCNRCGVVWPNYEKKQWHQVSCYGFRRIIATGQIRSM